ncbi:unnamed protein product (macronuclear) [Paramecium tetraurelia]|uniref:Rho-GAP domain-containing protein n=1 Tax=Paramecium tetraurelia TaxID=5888 RepID=A0CZI4_PARTE|nr:uncharacterized protein GSPATT00011774001 [Paramecium tetraurelia]CAK76201.1 unnamed protein product [Paramecium tetraurelia]|eukprot:XP_001443598.1 hypothetical protein (macronuclear) [Paramecium tetraurelia strain d4-2]
MDKKYTIKQYELNEEFKQKVQVGDFILTQTDSFIYSLARSILKIEYDHLLVLIKEDQLLHIGWPQIRIINPLQILSQSSRYIIFRPPYQEGELQKFIMYLQTSLKADYDYQKLLQGMIKKLVNKVPTDPVPFQPNLKSSRVCTDLIFYWLEASSAKFRELLPNYLGYLDYPLIGSFTPDDINTLAKMNVFFQIIHTKEIQNPESTLESLGRNIQNKGISNIFFAETPTLKQIKKLIQFIPYPQNFIGLIQQFIFGFQLIKLYQMPKKKRMKLLLLFVVKRYSNDVLDEKKQRKIVKKLMILVDTMEIIISPFQWISYIRLIQNIIELFFFTNQSAKDQVIKMIFKDIFKSKL